MSSRYKRIKPKAPQKYQKFASEFWGIAKTSFDLTPIMQYVKFSGGYLYTTNGNMLLKQSLAIHDLDPEEIRHLDGKLIHYSIFERIKSLRPTNIIFKENEIHLTLEFEAAGDKYGYNMSITNCYNTGLEQGQDDQLLTVTSQNKQMFKTGVRFPDCEAVFSTFTPQHEFKEVSQYKSRIGFDIKQLGFLHKSMAYGTQPYYNSGSNPYAITIEIMDINRVMRISVQNNEMNLENQQAVLMPVLDPLLRYSL